MDDPAHSLQIKRNVLGSTCVHGLVRTTHERDRTVHWVSCLGDGPFVSLGLLVSFACRSGLSNRVASSRGGRHDLLTAYEPAFVQRRHKSAGWAIRHQKSLLQCVRSTRACVHRSSYTTDPRRYGPLLQLELDHLTGTLPLRNFTFHETHTHSQWHALNFHFVCSYVCRLHSQMWKVLATSTPTQTRPRKGGGKGRASTMQTTSTASLSGRDAVPSLRRHISRRIKDDRKTDPGRWGRPFAFGTSGGQGAQDGQPTSGDGKRVPPPLQH